MMQLRTGRIPLNRHLFQMKKAKRPMCPHCPASKETVKHFMLECRHYGRQRAEMRRILRRDGYRLKSMLAEEGYRDAVLKYIRDTRRFDA